MNVSVSAVGVVGTAVGTGNGSVPLTLLDGMDGPTTLVSMTVNEIASPGLHGIDAVISVGRAATGGSVVPFWINVTARLVTWSPDTTGLNVATAVDMGFFLPKIGRRRKWRLIALG